jgi:tetratricopeptide (TPR) repeat protein
MFLGGILRHWDPHRALDVYDHALRHLAEAKNDVHLERYEVNLLAGSTYALSHMERFDQARRRLDMAFDRLKQLKFYPVDTIGLGSEAAETVQASADYQAARGNLSSAINEYQELLKKIQSAKSGLARGLDDAVHLSTIYSSAAALYSRAGRADLAAALEARRLDLWRQWDHRLSNNDFVRRQLELPSLR